MRRIILVAFVFSALATIGPSSAFGGSTGGGDGCPPGITDPDYCEPEPCGVIQVGGQQDDDQEGTECDGQRIGGGGDDEQNGYGGNDCQEGDNGAGVMNGGRGDDLQFGGNGNDTIRGGPGNDHIWAGAGHDTVNCGAGDFDVAFVDRFDTTTNCEFVIQVRN